MEEEFTSLKEEIQKLREKLEEKTIEKKKDFKFLSRIRLSPKKLKENFVIVEYIHNNGQIEFLKAPIEESTMMIKGIPRLALPSDILYYNKKPFIILPEWSYKPFSKKEEYSKAVEENLTNEGFSLLINRMHKEAIASKKKLSGWIILLVFAVIGIIIYFLLGGNKLFVKLFGG